MFPPTDNPAQRLLDILKKAQGMQNMAVSKMWAQVFNIPDLDPPGCYRVLGHLNNLVDSIEARIRQVPDVNHELYLRDLPTIRQIICVQHLGQGWHEIKRPLDHGVLTGLEFCANELSKLHTEEAIPEEILAKIRAEFAELFDSVSNAEISSDLKLVLYDILTSAILAIDQYKILGNDGLKKAVAYTLGMLALHKKEFLGAKDGNVVKKTFTVIKHLVDVISVAYKVKQLSGDIPDILHLGGELKQHTIGC
jgi:hypothetical protein